MKMAISFRKGWEYCLSFQVLVLDEQGIHFFDDKGQAIKTILSEDSLNFRGLAWFHDEGKIHLATLEAENGATHVVVIDLQGERKKRYLDKRFLLKS